MNTLVILVRTIIFIFIIIIAFFISVPVGVTTHRFNGGCLLYGGIKTSSASTFTVQYGPGCNCSFIVYFHVVASMLIAAIFATLFAFTFKRNRTEMLDGFLTQLSLLAVISIICAITLVTCCILSVGFSSFCSSVLDNGYKRCDLLEHARWTYIDGSSFHKSFTMAMGASWICFLCWGIQTGFSAVNVYRSMRAKK